MKDGKALAKEILSGKETTVIGHLSKTEGKLGRSLVIDLPSKGYRQVDHRTLKWLIIRNVKYSVKTVIEGGLHRAEIEEFRDSYLR